MGAKCFRTERISQGLYVYNVVSHLIGIGRILTNPPSHTTHRAAPQWAVLNLTARRIGRLLIVTLGFHPQVTNREQSLLC